MSLRRDIHSAFESIAPPLGGMPERVVQTVLADKRRRRKEGMLLRLRAPLSLVAALVVIAVVAAVLVGGRLVQGWNTFHNSSPAGHSTGLSYQSQVALLEQRPLLLPTIKAGDACPNTGNKSADFQFGSGPVYANGSGGVPSAWGNFFSIPWYTDPHLTGPVLVRGTDLQGHSVVFSGPGAYGPVVGNDPAQASPELHSEFVFDAGHPAQRSRGYGMFVILQGLPTAAGPCAGFQVDGPSFAEIFTAAG